MAGQGLYEWLSGRVPGGLAVVPVAILFLTYIWIEVKRHSGLIGSRMFRAGLAAIVVFVLLNYALFRAMLAPVPVPARVVVLPLRAAVPAAAWAGEAAAFGIEQMLQRQGFPKTSVVRSRFITSLSSYAAAAVSDTAVAQLARRTGIRYLVTGTVTPVAGGYSFSVYYRDLKKGKLLFRLKQQVPVKGLPAFNRTAADAALRHFRLRGSVKDALISVTASPAAYRALADGRAALERDDFEAAETSFVSALHADTACAYALLGMGEAVRNRALSIEDKKARQELLATAARHLVAAIRKDRNLGAAYLELAWIHIFMEKWNEAENELKIALHHMPMDAQVYYLLSKLHRNRYVNYGFTSEGDILEKALVLSPVHLPAKLSLIDRYLNANRKADATRMIDEILSVDPGNTQAAVTLSLVHIYKSEWEASIGVCRKVLEKEPDNADALYNLGISFKGLAEYDSALVYLRRAAEQGQLNAYNYMAVIHEARGELYTAIKMLRTRVRLGERGEKWRDESRKSLFRLVHKAGIVVDTNFTYQQLAESPAVDSALILQERK